MATSQPSNDVENIITEEQCENLMSIVVESRKRFRKMCIDYDQKSAVIENKMLDSQLDNIAKHRVKNKSKLPDIDLEEVNKKADDFAAEVEERQKRIQELLKKIKNTQQVVSQLEHDNLTQRAHMQLTADNLLRIAKEKKKQKI